MVLIIGGAYQGKLDYAKEEYGLTDSDVFTCEEGSTAVGFDEKIVDHFERYILTLIKAGQVPEKAVGMQLRANRYKGRIIICDDISQGLVPMDATERAWREGVGRTMVRVAQQADKVVRVFCGIPVVLKDETESTAVGSAEGSATAGTEIAQGAANTEAVSAPKKDGLEAVFAAEANGAVKQEDKPHGVGGRGSGNQAGGLFSRGGQTGQAPQAPAGGLFGRGGQTGQAPQTPAGGLFGQVGLPHLDPGENGADEGLTPEEQFRKMFEKMKKERAAAKEKAAKETAAKEKTADEKAAKEAEKE